MLPPLIDTFKCERRANGLGLEFDPAASPFLVMVRPEEGAPVPPEPPSPPPEPTNEIPESLLSLFMLLLSDPLPLALLLFGVLEIDTDLGNLFSLALLPPCEIEIPAGNLGTLFGAVAFDAGSL